MSHYFTASTISELICFLVATICLIRDPNWIWRSMVIYLLITCTAEFSGIYVERTAHDHENYWVYNIFLIFDTGFTNLMFWYIFKPYLKSNLLTIGALVLFIILYAFELVNHGFFVYNNLTYTVMSVVYVLCGLYYYYLLLKDERYIYLKWSPAFWWVAGTLLFYFGNTACNLLDNELGGIKVYQLVTYWIFKVLNIILYGCWSYSFICRKWLSTKSEA